MKKLFLTFIAMLFAASVFAAADIEIDSPAIAALQSSMQARHSQLAGHYASGAVGLTREGTIALRDANAVPLAQRQAVNALIAAENQDRNALYREIARANKHPEWENEIRSTFAGRWVDKAQSGWWFQNASGAWTKK
ncbi:MAG: DUF1318 domain-containing protein [Burkholderiales bacterium]